MGVGARVLMVAAACLSGACSPTFDWREVRPSEDLVSLFPCRPQSHVRQVVLAGAPVEMSLLSCAAGGSTFAVSRVVVEDRAQIDRLMQAMRAALVSNLSPGAESSGQEPDQGATIRPGRLGGQRLDIRGQGPQGQSLQVRGEFFSRDGAIFQATVVGGSPDAEAVDFFFSSLRFR